MPRREVAHPIEIPRNQTTDIRALDRTQRESLARYLQDIDDVDAAFAEYQRTIKSVRGAMKSGDTAKIDNARVAGNLAETRWKEAKALVKQLPENLQGAVDPSNLGRKAMREQLRAELHATEETSATREAEVEIPSASEQDIARQKELFFQDAAEFGQLCTVRLVENDELPRLREEMDDIMTDIDAVGHQSKENALEDAQELRSKVLDAESAMRDAYDFAQARLQTVDFNEDTETLAAHLSAIKGSIDQLANRWSGVHHKSKHFFEKMADWYPKTFVNPEDAHGTRLLALVRGYDERIEGMPSVLHDLAQRLDQLVFFAKNIKESSDAPRSAA